MNRTAVGLSRPSTPFAALDGEISPSRLFFEVGVSLAAWMAGTSPATTGEDAVRSQNENCWGR